ncbi:MAG: glycosyltransferase family 9 protein [Chlorobi bacterium]|nr:glycosyltransferase family 9 protein [Chlorobiota bacterium]
MKYFSDCKHFRGDVPCRPHKQEGVHCADCPHYLPIDRNILIIKLGAIGDVIRTTPLIRKIRELHPNARLWWLSHTPEILPSEVDVPMRFDLRSVITLLSINFDLLINLDKDREACSLTDRIEASVKKGFILRNGVCAPLDDDAKHKFLTGIFDDLSKANTRNYLDEMFEIVGYEWKGEEYMLDPPEKVFDLGLAEILPVVGLNTGCGGRWTSRLWPEEYWIRLAKMLIAKGFLPLFLGGEQEHEKNMRLAAESGGRYLGHFPLPIFIAEMNACDLIVSGVTMAMHIAIGLRKKLILFNNIFNRHEFELFGRGEIIEPSKPCTCFYQPRCVNPDYHCMDYIAPETVLDRIEHWIAEAV